MASYEEYRHNDAKATSGYINAAPYGSPPGQLVDQRPLVERLETVVERLSVAHTTLDRLEGHVMPLSQPSDSTPIGAFARTEQCLSLVGHLNERLEKLVSTLGRL